MSWDRKWNNFYFSSSPQIWNLKSLKPFLKNDRTIFAQNREHCSALSFKTRKKMYHGPQLTAMYSSVLFSVPWVAEDELILGGWGGGGETGRVGRLVHAGAPASPGATSSQAHHPSRVLPRRAFLRHCAHPTGWRRGHFQVQVFFWVLWCFVHVCFVQVTIVNIVWRSRQTLVRALFYLYLFCDPRKCDNSMKVRAPRRVSASGAPHVVTWPKQTWIKHHNTDEHNNCLI